MNQPNEDKTLMNGVAAGHEVSLRLLYERFGALVFRNACQVLGSTSEAEDAVQDVFVQIWRTADRYDPSRSKLITWVMLISRRMLIDRLRRRMIRPPMGALDESIGLPAPQGAYASAVDPELMEHFAKVRRRMGELPELQREVIDLVYIKGFSLQEVAEQRQMPVGTIKSALSRGLQRLREKFGIEAAG